MNGTLPSTGLILLAAILLPAIAAISLAISEVAGPRRRRSLPIVSVTVSLGCVILAIGRSLATAGPSTFGAGRWLSVDGSPASGIEWLLHWDGLAQIWLMMITTAALLLFIDSAVNTQDTTPRSAAWRLVLLSAAQLAILSGSFLQLFIAWELALIPAWRLAASSARDADDAAAARRMLLTGLAADAPLLTALMAMWRTYGSFDFAAVLAPQEQSWQTQAAFTLIALGVAASVLVRCAQFPFVNWFLDIAHLPAAADGLAMGVFPLGSYLLVRSLPVLAQVPAVGALLSGMGVLSLVTAGLLAVTRPNMNGALAAFVSGTYGLLLCGIGTAGLAQPDLLLLAAALCVPGSLAIAAASPDESGTSTALAWPLLILLAVLAGGILGQEAVLTRLWMRSALVEASPADGVAAEESLEVPAPSLGPIIPVAAIFGQLLVSTGLFRAWLVGRGEGRQPVSRQPALLLVIASLSPIPIVLAPLLIASGSPAQFPFIELLQLLNPGLTGLVTALSLLMAWILYARPNRWPSRIEQACGGLAGAIRQRFYLDDLERLLIRIPLAAVSLIAGAVETISEDNLERRDRIADASPFDGANSAEQDDNVPVLALFLTAACILLVLLW